MKTEGLWDRERRLGAGIFRRITPARLWSGLALDPADPATLYAATQRRGVFKSTDAGETWSLAGLWPSGSREVGPGTYSAAKKLPG